MGFGAAEPGLTSRRGEMEKLRAQAVLLTGQGMRIRGFSSSLSPLCLVLQLLALPQAPQHRCCVAQAQGAGVHPNFALLRGRSTTPQHPWPQRFPFLRIKGDVSPRTTTTLKKNKHNPPKKATLELLLSLCLLLHFRWDLGSCCRFGSFRLRVFTF